MGLCLEGLACSYSWLGLGGALQLCKGIVRHSRKKIIQKENSGVLNSGFYSAPKLSYVLGQAALFGLGFILLISHLLQVVINPIVCCPIKAWILNW